MHLLLETRWPLSRYAHCDFSVVTLWCQSTSLRKSSWLLFKDLGAVRVGQNRRRAFHLEEVLTQNSVLHLRDILSLPRSSNRAGCYRQAAFQCVLTLPCNGGPRSDPPALSRRAPPVPLPAVPAAEPLPSACGRRPLRAARRNCRRREPRSSLGLLRWDGQSWHTLELFAFSWPLPSLLYF